MNYEGENSELQQIERFFEKEILIFINKGETK